MIKFKKHYNLKIISIVISAILLFTNTVYPSTFPKDTLRPPIGTEDDTLGRVEETYYREIGEEGKGYLVLQENSGEDEDLIHLAYKVVLARILKEGAEVLFQFYKQRGHPEAEIMARDFAEDSLVSIIRRDTEPNFWIPYIPEGFPTTSQLINTIIDRPPSEQKKALEEHMKQIVKALLTIEIPTILRKRWAEYKQNRERKMLPSEIDTLQSDNTKHFKVLRENI